MTTKITTEDVLKVASDLNMSVPTPDIISFVLDNYDDESQNDPTGMWYLYIENLLYQFKN